jgi:hypothetical protein
VRLLHIATIGGEIVAVFLAYWLFSTMLRPDAVHIVNDTARAVTLANCQHAFGVANPVEIEPGETAKIHATRACQVHSPEYVGCLPILAEAYRRDAKVEVSEMDAFVSADTCAATDTRQRPDPWAGR